MHGRWYLSFAPLRPAEIATLNEGLTLDAATIAKLTRLAALRLTAREEAELRQDLNKIVAFVDAMQAAETDGVAPLSHPLDGTTPLRPDRVTEEVSRERMQEGAPAVRDGLYLVPRVVE